MFGFMLLYIVTLLILKFVQIKSQSHDCSFTAYYQNILPELYEYNSNPTLIPSKTNFYEWRSITNRLI